jgi:Ion transport protein
LPGTYCHALKERKIPLEYDQVDDWDSIQYGYFQFDNIGAAILSIFRVITLEGWTLFMYNYMDTSGPISAIYFPIVVVVGSFFMLQLFLAVIMETFSETSEKLKGTDWEDQQEKKQLEQFERKSIVPKTDADKKIDKMIDVNH